jgi:hypothetical protein
MSGDKVDRVDPKNETLQEWVREAFRVTQLMAKITPRALIDGKLMYCLDVAWAKIIEAEDSEPTTDFYQYLQNKGNQDRWIRYFMDPGVSTEPNWQAIEGASHLFHETGNAIAGQPLENHHHYGLGAGANSQEGRDLRNRLAQDRRDLSDRLGRLESFGSIYLDTLSKRLFGPELRKPAAYAALSTKWTTSQAYKEEMSDWCRAHHLINMLRKELQLNRPATLQANFVKLVEILQRTPGTMPPSLVWTELKKIAGQLQSSQIELPDKSIITLFETTLSTREEARWARTRDQNDLEASIGVLDSVESPYREARIQRISKSAQPREVEGLSRRPLGGAADNPSRLVRLRDRAQQAKSPGQMGLNAGEVCGHCGKPGHNKQDCWTLYPDKRLKRKREDNRPNDNAPRARVGATAAWGDQDPQEQESYRAEDTAGYDALLDEEELEY